MSNSPNAFGLYEPTLLVRPSAPLSPPRTPKFAWEMARVVPEEKGVEVPARQAYSHSASVGKRYFLLFSCSSSRSDSFFRKVCASARDTFSTGRSSVLCRSFTLSLPPPGGQEP